MNKRAPLFFNRNMRRLLYVLLGNEIALVFMNRKKRAPGVFQQDLKVVPHLLSFTSSNRPPLFQSRGRRELLRSEPERRELVSFSIRNKSTPLLLTRTSEGSSTISYAQRGIGDPLLLNRNARELFFFQKIKRAPLLSRKQEGSFMS